MHSKVATVGIESQIAGAALHPLRSCLVVQAILDEPSRQVGVRFGD